MYSDYQKHTNDWNVSRETISRIEIFVDVLYQWQARINLISAPKYMSREGFVELVWQRHIIDSLQLLTYISENPIVDLGSGGGFPGLILSIATHQQVHLIESDNRKCEFLREAARLTQAHPIIHNKRIEEVDSNEFSNKITITSRACASILKLLDLTKHFHSNSDFLLLKGEKANMELEEARKHWKMSVDCFPSATNNQSSIIHLQGVQPHG